MRSISNKYTLFYVLICSIISAALINDDTFGNKTLFAFFIFVIASSFFSAVVAISVLRKNVSLQILNPWPIVILVLSSLYYLIQDRSFDPQGTNIFLLYQVSNTILLIALCIFFTQNRSKIMSVYKIIAAFAFLEAMICMLQFFNIISSQNNLFKVTGTWVNPNVTAMFLAMAIPAVLHLLVNSRGRYRKVYVFLLAVIVIGLLLLKCRTAFIGGAISSIILLNYRYNLWHRYYYRFSFTKKWLLGVLFIITILFSTAAMYQTKRASADGRQLIWKISMGMIKEKPLTGYGYGKFERPYNLAQANYFANGQGTEKETENASFVLMAYNEFLQNTVEGGVAGLLLFAGLFIALLFPSIINRKKKETEKKQLLSEIAAFAGIVSFAIMSVFNFTVQAIPAMCIFIIYASIACTNSMFPVSLKGRPFQFSKWSTSVLSLLAIMICFVTVSFAHVFTKVKKSNELIRLGNSTTAIEILASLQEKLSRSQYYWQMYGTAFIKQKAYLPAMGKLDNALTLTANPETYMQAANCCIYVKEYDKAVTYFTFAKNIQPGRMAPRYGLMNTYRMMNDTTNAINTAKELLVMEPKANVKIADFYEKAADGLLNDYRKNIKH